MNRARQTQTCGCTLLLKDGPFRGKWILQGLESLVRNKLTQQRAPLIDVRVRLRTRRNQIPVSVDVNEREAYGLPMLDG